MRRIRRDRAQVQVLEAVLVGILILATVLFVLSYSLPSSPTAKTRAELELRSRDALSVVHELPTSDWKYGDNTLSKFVAQSIQGDSDNITGKLDNLLGVGTSYSVYIDNGYEPFEIYKKRDPLGETVTGTRIMTPQWTYDLLISDLNFYDGLADMGIYSLPVKSSKVEEMRGELLNITLRGDGISSLKQHEITAEGSTVSSVHSSEVNFLLDDELPYQPIARRLLIVTDLSSTGSPQWIEFFVRLRESQNSLIPLGSSLVVRLPPDWDDPEAVDAPNADAGWSAGALTGSSDLGWSITSNRTSTLANSSSLFKFRAVMYTSKASDHFYEFSAELSNGTLGRARMIVEVPSGVGTASARPILAATVPYPMGVNAETTFAVGFANGLNDVTLGELSVSSVNNQSLFKGVIGLTPSSKAGPNYAGLNQSRAFAATGADPESMWIIGGEMAGASWITADITRINATNAQSNASFMLPVNLSHMAHARSEDDGATLIFGGKLLSGFSPYIYHVLPARGEVLNLSTEFRTFTNTTALSSDFESSGGWTFASKSSLYNGAPGADGGPVTTQAHAGTTSYKVSLTGNQSITNRTFVYRSVAVTPNVPTLVTAWVYDSFDPGDSLARGVMRQYLAIDGTVKAYHDPWENLTTGPTGWVELSAWILPETTTMNVSVGVEMEDSWFGPSLTYDTVSATYIDDVTIVQHQLPPARAGASAAFDHRDQVLYVFGGYNGTQFFSDILRIDLVADEMTLAGTMPSARANTSALWDPVTRRAYAFGGHDGTSYYNTTVIYDTATGFVTAPSGSDLPRPIAGALVAQDELYREAYLMGGINSLGYNRSIMKFHAETEGFMKEVTLLTVNPRAFAMGGFVPGNTTARVYGGVTTSGVKLHTNTTFTTSGWHLVNSSRVSWLGARSVVKTTSTEFVFNVTANGHATGHQNASYAYTPVTFDNAYAARLDHYANAPFVYYRDIPPDKVNTTSGSVMSTGYKARDTTTRLVVNGTFNVSSSLLLGKKSVSGKAAYDANGVSSSTLVGQLRGALYNSTMDVERRYYTLGGVVNVTVRAQSLVDSLAGLGALNILETTKIYGPASLDSGVPIKTLTGSYAEGTVSPLSKVNIINSNGIGSNDVVVGSKGGLVYAIDGDGTHALLWQKGVGSQVSALASGRLGVTNYGTVAGTCDGTLYSLLGASGDTVWSHKFDFSVTAVALHDNDGDGIVDYVYAGAGGTCQNTTAHEGQLAKFTSAGTQVWKKKLLTPLGSIALGTIGNHTNSATFYATGGLVVQGFDGTVAGFTFDGEGKWTYTPTGTPRRNVTSGGTRLVSVGDLDGPKPPLVKPKVVETDLNGDGIGDYLSVAPTNKIRAYNGISAGNVYSGVLQSGLLTGAVLDAAFLDEERGFIVGEDSGTAIVQYFTRGQAPSGYIIINATKPLRFTSVTHPFSDFFAITGVAGAVGDPSLAGANMNKVGDGLVWVCDNKSLDDITCIDGQAATMDASNFTLFPNVPINGIQFVDRTIGYFVGHNAVYKTTDRGISWTNVTPSTMPVELDGYPFVDLHFISTTTGWVVGDNGYVFKTTDGGATWSRVQIQAQSGTAWGFPLFTVQFYNATHGWTAGGGVREKVQAACYRATSSASLCASIKTNLNGNASNAGDIYYTTNGGSTWARGNVGGLQEVPNDLSFHNATHGVAVGTGSRLWRTVDAGRSWHSEPSPAINNWTVVVTPGANYTYVFGGGSKDASYLMGHSLVAGSERIVSKSVGSFGVPETIASVYIEVPVEDWTRYFLPAAGSSQPPILLEVTNDGGTTWVSVTGNKTAIFPVTFSVVGNDLRWRMTISSNAYGLSITPRTNMLNLSYNGTVGGQTVYRETFSTTANYEVGSSGAQWNTTLQSARLQTYGDLWSWDVQALYAGNSSVQLHDVDSGTDFTGDGVNDTLFDVGSEIYLVNGVTGLKVGTMKAQVGGNTDAVPYLIRSTVDGLFKYIVVVSQNKSQTDAFAITAREATAVGGLLSFSCTATFGGSSSQINDIAIGELVATSTGTELAVVREDGTVLVYSISGGCSASGDALWSKTPQAIPGNYRHTWTIPQNSFFGAYPVITEISWTQVVGVSIAGSARLVDYFVVTLPDGTVAENPAYNVKLVAWFEDWG